MKMLLIQLDIISSIYPIQPTFPQKINKRDSLFSLQLTGRPEKM